MPLPEILYKVPYAGRGPIIELDGFMHCTCFIASHYDIAKINIPNTTKIPPNG